MSLSTKTIGIIKATAPVVAPHAQKITGAFYKKMFSRHRQLFQFFNKTNQIQGKQPHALADAVIAYASNIDHLEVLGEPVKLMAVKHCALQVQPEHYSIVHDTLMETIGEILGSAVTTEVGQAWSEAVTFLATILINEEKRLYEEAASRSGGWRGWKQFTLTSKTALTKNAHLFKFERADGNRDPIVFTPGQYLTLNTHLIDEIGDAVAPRHYTVASQSGKPFLEIAIKGIPGGRVSNYLRDKLNVGETVDLSPPFGAFVLDPKDDPVLLSAGIGITPMMAFGKQMQSEGKNVKNLKHVHVDGSENFPWKQEYYPQGDLHVDVRKTTATDVPKMEELHQMLGGKDVSKKDVYICGPLEFMTSAVPYFQQNARSVKYENFGPRVQIKGGH